jgi:hypothetical protein
MDNPEKLVTYGTQDEEKHRETGNIWYTRRRKTQRNWQHMVHKTKKTKQRHNIICVGHHYAQTNTNNVNKTWALLQNCM